MEEIYRDAKFETKTARKLSTKVMIFNSFTVTNDYNFGGQ